MLKMWTIMRITLQEFKSKLIWMWYAYLILWFIKCAQGAQSVKQLIIYSTHGNWNKIYLQLKKSVYAAVSLQFILIEGKALRICVLLQCCYILEFWLRVKRSSLKCLTQNSYFKSPYYVNHITSNCVIGGKYLTFCSMNIFSFTKIMFAI